MQQRPPLCLVAIFLISSVVSVQRRKRDSGFNRVEAGRAFVFDADGGLLRLAPEAYCICLTYPFDPYLTVSAFQIGALPHQIIAVYGETLSRQPLRFLFASDPGGGKATMAGLLIEELLIRGDLKRCLILAPGALSNSAKKNWSINLGPAFELLTRDQIEASIQG